MFEVIVDIKVYFRLLLTAVFKTMVMLWECTLTCRALHFLSDRFLI